MHQTVPRSTFVTVLAWIFICLGAINTLVALLQNLMLYLLFRDIPAFSQLTDGQASHESGQMPALFSWMSHHIHWLIVLFLLASLFTMASAIGLLKRRNWARWCFIGLMALGIIWQVFGLVIQQVMWRGMYSQMPQAAVTGGPDMEPFMIAVQVVSYAMALAFSLLFGWIIKRLLSPAVAAEFGRTPAAR